MCRVICLCNQKGGVSKTTSTVNLGVGLAKEGNRVLLLDADPQGSLIIHNWPTRQYYLRERSGEHYDRHGFAVVDGRYVIACTTTFGKVGDYIDFVLDNGRVIHAIMGDEKNQSDPGCTRWGHDNGHLVVEFVVNKQMWYGHLGNSDITRFHPEWKSRVKIGVNLGKNYFDK